MRLLHTSDWHLGAADGERSLNEDQRFFIDEIIRIIEREKVDAVLIAGDVYDRSVASAEAIRLYDDAVTRICGDLGVPVCIIAGNHDGPERLSTCSGLLSGVGLHIAGALTRSPQIVSFDDAEIFLLPWITEEKVKSVFPEERDAVSGIEDAYRVAVNRMRAAFTPGKRHILIAHAFITNAETSTSDRAAEIGFAMQVPASVFDGFDYVALGHLHGPQNVGSDRIRYCGTPLKYSFSEASHEKSVTVAELGAPAASVGKTGDGSGKCELSVRTAALTPLREMRELKGSYEEVTAKKFYDGTSYREDFVHITLTDEEDVPDAFAKLQVIYRNLMKLSYDNRRTRHKAESFDSGALPQRMPEEHFGDFFLRQNGMELSQEQADFVKDLIEKVWGDAE